MSLYHITSEMKEILFAAESVVDGDPETAAAFAEATKSLVESFDTKAEAYAQLIRVSETRAAARREEAERMELLAKADEALADRLRRALMDAMISINRPKVETERFKLSVRKNGGKVPVIVTDETALPTEYRVPRVTEVIDKDGIRDALEAGKPVPGAALGERGQRLELK